jgi:cytosine permease
VSPPFVGIVIAHFWLLGRLGRRGDELLAEAPQLRVEAVLAWLLASLITERLDWFVSAINGVVLGAILYVALCWLGSALRPRRRGV